jgi:hypothetical protein
VDILLDDSLIFRGDLRQAPGSVSGGRLVEHPYFVGKPFLVLGSATHALHAEFLGIPRLTLLRLIPAMQRPSITPS